MSADIRTPDALSPVVEIDDLSISFATDAGRRQGRGRGEPHRQSRRGPRHRSGNRAAERPSRPSRSSVCFPRRRRWGGAVLLSNRAGTATNDVVSLDTRQLRAVRGADVSMVFQEPSTRAEPRVHRGLGRSPKGSGAHDAKLSRADAKREAIDILRKVGIPDPETRVDYYPHQFSGGQKQRVVIASALVLNPGLIVADEPTTALDVTVQAEILDLLRRLRDEFGTAIVLITHNMGVVADLADRVAVMYQGVVVEEADAATLFRAPRNEYTKKLLDAVPRIGQGRVRHGRACGGTGAAARIARLRRPGGRPGGGGHRSRDRVPREARPEGLPRRERGVRSASRRAKCSASWVRADRARPRSAGRSAGSPGSRVDRWKYWDSR